MHINFYETRITWSSFLIVQNVQGFSVLYNNHVCPVRRVSTLLTFALPHHFTKRGGSVLYNKLRPATFN